jgi:hypothetical protein
MPLAAYAQWCGGELAIDVALGHPQAPASPLLRARAQAGVRTPGDAEALGVAAAESLRRQGAATYLHAAGAA